MPITVNVRHLETQNVDCEGELAVAELDLGLRDAIVRAEKPLRYALEVQKLDTALLLQGRLQLVLRCECVRCLKAFDYVLELAPWTAHVPLEGEEKALVINDCVDLTPYVREDILLELPQHPLCGAACCGLPRTDSGKANKTSGSGSIQRDSLAWGELDKLKL
jgi:uncharacterized metal-binding protein YceD (DUF177 family)